MTMIALVPRYLAVGGTCALLNIAILVAGDMLHLPLAISVAISFITVCIVGYRLHAGITFVAPVSRQGFVRYVLAMAVSLPASTLLLWLFARVLEWPMSYAAPCITVMMLFVNFLASRWAVMRPRDPVGMRR